MPLVVDVLNFLTNNVPEVSGHTLRAGVFPDEPDLCVAVTSSVGGEPETTMAIDYPAFQIRVRGEEAEYVAVSAVASAIYKKLHGGELLDEDVSPSDPYTYCYATSNPLMIGYDFKNRPVFSINFKAMRNVN